MKLKDAPHVVRSRSAFIPPKPEREVKNASPLWTAISGLTPAKDVAMRLNVAPFAIPEKKEVALVITLGLRQPIEAGAKPISETVTFLAQAFTPSGKKQGSPRYNSVSLQLKPNPSGEVKYEVLSRIDVKPGRYHIRMSAQSRALGKSGSIYYDVDVPDFSKAPLSLSGVVVSAMPSLVSGPRELLKWLLPVVPTSQREFTFHQGSAFFRIYQGGKTPLLPVAIVARIVDTDNAVAFEVADAVPVSRFDRLRTAEYRFTLPIDRLFPGEYPLTFRATAGDAPSASRDVRFQVSERR